MNRSISPALVLVLCSALLFLVVPLVAPAAGVTIWYVDSAAGSDGNDCLAPTSACESVGEAIGRSSAGDTVEVAAGLYTENISITHQLALNGSGPAATILDGGQQWRVLYSSGSLILSNLTVQNGHIDRDGDIFTSGGAGIFNSGDLTLQNVDVVSNTTTTGNGAGIFHLNGTLSVTDSELRGNVASGAGGGIYDYRDGLILLTNSLLEGNEAIQGGGITFNGSSSLVLDHSTVRDNFGAQFGGGVASNFGTATLTHSTVDANRSDGYGAGIINYGTMTLTNMTVSGNVAPQNSGLMNMAGSEISIVNSTIAYNRRTAPSGAAGVTNFNGATLSIKNSIVANNEGWNCTVSGSWTSLGANLSSDTRCDFLATADLQNSDPRLGPLGDYGGATQTHPLLPDSPALDSADNNGCPATDQRDVPRPLDGDDDGLPTCDRGAYEVRSQLTIADSAVQEGNSGTTSAHFTVTLAPPSDESVTVEYETSDGSALAGSDYTSSSGMLTFSAGETTQVIEVPVLGDLDDESDESFTVTLSGPVNADIVDSEAVGTILDDDGLSSIGIGDASASEGNTGITPMVFTLSLSPASAQSVTVEYLTGSGSATAGIDFELVGGTVTFQPGETEKTISVHVTGDVVDEGESESFVVDLSNPQGANLGDEQATGTILDDDTARIGAGVGPQLLEGDSGTTNADFTISLSNPTDFVVTVEYETQGNSATEGKDYEPVSGMLTFQPGEMEKVVSVPVIGDTVPENDESFSLRLRNPDPISLSTNTSIATILNDDDAPTATPQPTSTATPQVTATTTPQATPTGTPQATTPTGTPQATPTGTPQATPTGTPQATPVPGGIRLYLPVMQR